MGEDFVLALGAEALKTTIYLAGPMLIAALLVGLVVSILQAMTQINEATLTFIPKMIAIVLVLLVMGPWMMEVMKSYTADIFGNPEMWIR